MKYLLNANQMKQADTYTIEQEGIPSRILMERAAHCVVDKIRNDIHHDSRVLLVCGSGNNGGDGFAAARFLAEEGCVPTVVFVGKEEKCTVETKYQLDRCRQMKIPVAEEIPEEKWDMIIDAVFGIGLCREISGKYYEVIEQMNHCSGKKVAVDIASGVSADTGCVFGTAFRADLTITFAYAKIGQLLYPGKSYTGELIVCDIGIQGDPKEKQSYCMALDQICAADLLPVRKQDSHKGTYGKGLIAAGSKGMCGAAFLSGLAAYRCGCGLVRIFTHESNRIILQTLLPEAIIDTYSEEETVDAVQEKMEACIQWADAMVLGPGLGTSPLAGILVKKGLERDDIPMILDADALNIISAENLLSRLPEGNCILTPHIKEMSRLSGVGVSDILKNQTEVAVSFAKRIKNTVVLKNSTTSVVDETGERTALNLSGNSALAKGGSGDVLTGVLLAFACQKMPLFDAAVLGAWVHGTAGEKASRIMGEYGVLARETADQCAPVLKELASLRTLSKGQAKLDETR